METLVYVGMAVVMAFMLRCLFAVRSTRRPQSNRRKLVFAAWVVMIGTFVLLEKRCLYQQPKILTDTPEMLGHGPTTAFLTSQDPKPLVFLFVSAYCS